MIFGCTYSSLQYSQSHTSFLSGPYSSKNSFSSKNVPFSLRHIDFAPLDSILQCLGTFCNQQFLFLSAFLASGQKDNIFRGLFNDFQLLFMQCFSTYQCFSTNCSFSDGVYKSKSDFSLSILSVERIELLRLFWNYLTLCLFPAGLCQSFR
ncbi:E4 ORF1' [bat adenovirus 10]|uniref:E4 ORF1 n=1 Tax=bat adenovirus 10 TaxID=3070193 RepID=A0A1X9RIX8_9ADEN|nr:E4 ORF1' [Bat mastadenovirus WIV18]ARQ79799.1 E4 ORF1' [bat adenovirus 10]